MPPKLRVLSVNDRHEARLKTEISNKLASIVQSDSKMTPGEAIWSIKEAILANNPYQPLANGKCPINDLPDEILGYIFSIGVKEQEREEWDGAESEAGEEDEEEEWEDVNEEDGGAAGAGKEEEEPTEIVDVIDVDPNPFDSDSDYDSDMFETDDGPQIPYQVLVSHVCKRWRAVALDSHILWTTLTFAKKPQLEKAKVYIERANGLPLNISIDCTFPENIDDEDHPDHPLYQENLENRAKQKKEHCGDDDCTGHDDDDEDMRFLSQPELTDILKLISPEVSHWRIFDFRASTYSYVQMVLACLHTLHSAPLLEMFQIFHFEDCEDYDSFPGDDKTFYLPFHGIAPMLKDAAFWGVHIDWDGAVDNLLSGLKELELSFHAKDVRPSYTTFAKMMNNSPDLQTLSLSLSGPALQDDVAFDAEIEDGGWGPDLLTIPSLKEFSCAFHDTKYASALMRHLDMPNVTSLLLNFDEEDYSSFVPTLLTPVKGRTESLMSHIDHLKIAGLPCDVASVEAIYSQLTKLVSLNIKVVGPEESVFFEKLIKPEAGRPTSGESSSSAAGSSGSSQLAALPSVFCPQLVNVTTNQVTGGMLRNLVEARKAAGVPLKRISMSHDDPVTREEEKWLRANVEELDFFEPSDSEDELSDGILYGDDLEEESSDEDGDDHADEVDEDGDALMSPLARHLGPRRRGREAASLTMNATASVTIPGFVPHIAVSDEERSIFSIVWSCVATLFACAWVAVHPDVPGLDDEGFDHFFHRVKLLGWVLISPEAVLVWAWRQHRGAQALRYMFNHKEQQVYSKNWDLGHGHFLQMGGFVICPDKEDPDSTFIASPEQLRKLTMEGVIDFPTEVKICDIDDKNKGDGLTYFIAIGQLIWFVTQCIARTVVGLSITLFELVAVSFAPLTIVMYVLWWKKPQNAQAPIVIMVKPDQKLGDPEKGKSLFEPPKEANAVLSFIQAPVKTFEDMLGTTRRSQSIPPRSRKLPRFYAYPHEHDPDKISATPLWAGSFLGTMFGIIHILGWNFKFATRLEMLLWRASCVVIIAAPLLTVFNVFSARKNLHPKRKRPVLGDGEKRASEISRASDDSQRSSVGHICRRIWYGFTAGVLAFGYIAARLILLGVMCSSLRALPGKQLQGVDWITDIPHIL
ncbi:hypothetical protein D9619_007196 [Psilocybe cf. subviscida]|uniref:F-box domain-containing protein n=1 Tax=Psilocybe cf. subviscida TaxID=2480587 RepID=A0A8H5B229_9AGAR|nr:hypothetical protein D9619_007196 [Psilocybe cf. subviscida]